MASVLQRIVEKGHCRFVDRLDSWQQGVLLSTEALIADGSVEPSYPQQIIDCIEKYGPYVVFDHDVAMPHSQENTTGVRKSAIGFLRVKEPVSFGKDASGADKKARLLFTLASVTPDEHLNNIQQLAFLFCNEDLLDALIAAETAEDLLAADARFPAAAF